MLQQATAVNYRHQDGRSTVDRRTSVVLVEPRPSGACRGNIKENRNITEVMGGSSRILSQGR